LLKKIIGKGNVNDSEIYQNGNGQSQHENTTCDGTTTNDFAGFKGKMVNKG
jgi:hypothetical protein